jgi:hypothetical protein
MEEPSILGKRPSADDIQQRRAQRRQQRQRQALANNPAATGLAEPAAESSEAMDEEERLAALDAALAGIPAETRQFLSTDDTRMLLESRVALQLAEATADAERLRADLYRTDIERKRLTESLNKLERELADAQFANIEDDPRYQALAQPLLAVVDQQIRDSTLYQDLQSEVVSLREQLAAALERAERAEAEAQAAQERFLRDTQQLQQALAGVAAQSPSAVGTNAVSTLGWQTFGLLALADLAEQAVSAGDAIAAQGPPYYYYMASPDVIFDRFVGEAAQRASDYIENNDAAPIRDIIRWATEILDQVDRAFGGRPLNESQRRLYDEALADVQETVNARSVQLDQIESAAQVDRLAATYRGIMAQAYQFMRAASMLDDLTASEQISRLLPVVLTQGPQSAPYLLAAALWRLQGETGASITVPLAASNVVQAWTAARVMRALWWPLARVILDPTTTLDTLGALWTQLVGPNEPIEDIDITTSDGRAALYARLQAAFVAAFEQPTVEGLLQVWRAVDPDRPAADLARLLCGIVASGSARLLRVPFDFTLACQGLEAGTSGPDVVLDQMGWLFGFSLPPWNSQQVPVAAALLLPPGRAPPGGPPKVLD